jgi:hypothetical protein
MLLNIRQLMDDAKCYEVVRELRWPGGGNVPRVTQGRSTSGDTANSIAVRSVDDNSMTLHSILRIGCKESSTRFMLR